MPATQAISSFGTQLQIGDGATPTENFTAIAEVMDIQLPQLSLDTEEVTHHSSPQYFEEFIGTVIRSGEVTFDVNYLPGNATHNSVAGLQRDLRNRTRRNFRIILTDAAASLITFAALVTAFGGQAPVAGRLNASVTLKPTGVVTVP